jgi:hypothetical protein
MYAIRDVATNGINGKRTHIQVFCIGVDQRGITYNNHRGSFRRFLTGNLLGLQTGVHRSIFAPRGSSATADDSEETGHQHNCE